MPYVTIPRMSRSAQAAKAPIHLGLAPNKYKDRLTGRIGLRVRLAPEVVKEVGWGVGTDVLLQFDTDSMSMRLRRAATHELAASYKLLSFATNKTKHGRVGAQSGPTGITVTLPMGFPLIHKGSAEVNDYIADNDVVMFDVPKSLIQE